MSIQKKWRGLNRLAEGALTCLTTAVFASKRSVYERAFPFSLTKALLVSIKSKIGVWAFSKRSGGRKCSRMQAKPYIGMITDVNATF